jgi:mannose-6-phosphate isomerase-like protein (cupin superfamily)
MIAAMSETNRREFGIGLAMLGTMAAAAKAQEVTGTGTLGASKVFVPALTEAANGSQRWAGLNGTFATGEAVAMHESVIPAGTPKGTLHVIKHSELTVVLEGTLSFQHDDVIDTARAGSVIYVAYGTNHLVWNSGESAARYLVMQVGGDTRKPV